VAPAAAVEDLEATVPIEGSRAVEYDPSLRRDLDGASVQSPDDDDSHFSDAAS